MSFGPIHGRDRELLALDAVVAELSDRPGLVLAGEPGIGISALLEAAGRRASARGVRVLTARGGSLTLDEVLGLLAAGNDRREPPTLLLLDDGDRVDERGWDALVHATPRLAGVPFAMVVALGEGSPRLRAQDLPILEVGPLTEPAARAVLAGVATGLPTFITERIVEAAAGNPMALVELAGATPDAWRRQCVRPPIALPLSPRLVRGLAAEVETLPLATREILLAAAANDSTSLNEAVRAAATRLKAGIEETLAAAQPAFARRIVEGDAGTIRFRSEAARSAIYQAASLPRRHAMHVALARLLAKQPYRAVWHRAAASLMPDEALAEQLSDAANAVREHGRIRDALATMDRAARVSQDPFARVPRLLEAAELAYEIGRADIVATFLEQAESAAQTSEHRHWIAMLQGLYDLWRPDDGRQAHELVAAAQEAYADGDAMWTRTLLTQLVEKAKATRADRAPKAQLLALADRIGEIADAPALTGPLSVVCPAERGAEVLAYLRETPADADGDPLLARVHGDAAMTLGDADLALPFLTASIDQLRAEGRLGLLPFALLDRARCHLATAGCDAVVADLEEGLKLADETAQPFLVGCFRALEARIAGAEGDLARAEVLADAAERTAGGRGALLVDVHLARGRSRLAAQDADGAFAALIALWDDDLPLIAAGRRWAAIGDLAEAAAAIGRGEEVRPLVEALATAAAAVPSPLLRVTLPYARAMLAPYDDGEDELWAARSAATARGPFSAGRVHLAYGAWLCRHDRGPQARLELEAAVASFDAAGAPAWSARAHDALRAVLDGSRRWAG